MPINKRNTRNVAIASVIFSALSIGMVFLHVRGMVPEYLYEGLAVFVGGASILAGASSILFGIIGLLRAFKRSEDISVESQKKLLERRNEAEEKIKADSSDTKAAWDVARYTLEQYFNRNLQQVRQIFVVAIVVMLIGFVFVMFGVWTALNHPTEPLGPIVATLAGIVSQFIGMTFMQIHRATMQQANQYVDVLDRINAVGMSVQILEGIPEADPLSIKTRAEMARLLLETINRPRRSQIRNSAQSKRSE